MSDEHHQEHHDGHNEEAAEPTQAQLYDDLRRIGQLEDQKHQIQQEIDERTDRLRKAIPTLEKSSLLYKMLASSMKPAAKRRTAKKKSSKK